uniref:Uncharacterized protein n=1 Tax=Tanacetum cinerariifolium TaxID=118510 RepID=A0A6L2JIA1_TANCI|nr:hypothetical protein [Tanacetum cinerariifolium]
MILEEFRDILNICPRIEGQEFLDPPYEEEALSFMRHVGHTVRSSTSLILQLITFHQLDVYFVDLIWEDLVYQIENKDAKNSDKMYCPRFTKFIINHYLTRNSSISRRNRMFIHTARDDTKLGILKFVSKYEDIQVYSALIPKEVTNADMLESESFKTYYVIPTAAEPVNIKSKGSLNQNHLKKLQQENDDDEEGTKVASDDDHEEISDDNEGCNDDNVKDDDDDSEENVDDAYEMTKLDNDEEDINLDERILTLEFHEEKDKEDYDDLYGDFNMNLIIKNVEKTNADQARVALTTKGQEQSSSVSFDFTSKMLTLENIYAADYTITSIMDTPVCQPSSMVIITNPLPHPLFLPPPQQTTPVITQTTLVITPTNQIPITSAPVLLDFASVDGERRSQKSTPKDPLKEASDFTTPLIQSTIVESHKNVVLAKSSLQPNSTYEETSSLTEFKLKKMLEIVKLSLWIISSTMISNTYKVEAQVADTQHQQPRSKLLCTATLKALKTWFQLYRLKSSLDMRNTLVGESITRRIIGVADVEVDKQYDYGYLKKIAVQREDQQLYMFKEGDCQISIYVTLKTYYLSWRLKRNIERFVRGGEYGNALRLLERTI